MTVSATAVGTPHVFGDLQVRIVELAFDSSYPTGGESVTPAMLGLNTIDFLLVEPAGGYSFEYVHATSLLLARWVDTSTDGAPLAEVADTTSMSGVTGIRAIAFGR